MNFSDGPRFDQVPCVTELPAEPDTVLEVDTQSQTPVASKHPPSSTSPFVKRVSHGGCAAAVLPRGAGLDYSGTSAGVPRIDDTPLARSCCTKSQIIPSRLVIGVVPL